MRLVVEILVSDLADQSEIDSVKADVGKVLKHHTPWILRPKDLPEMPGIDHTGIVGQWRFPGEDDDEWYA